MEQKPKRKTTRQIIVNKLLDETREYLIHIDIEEKTLLALKNKLTDIELNFLYGSSDSLSCSNGKFGIEKRIRDLQVRKAEFIVRLEILKEMKYGKDVDINDALETIKDAPNISVKIK